MGWREPSGPAKVPAPQGEPGGIHVLSNSPLHYSEQTRTAVNFSEIRQLAKGSSIPQGDKRDAVVSKGRLRCKSRGLLSTTMAGSGDEHSSVLAVQFALLPQLAGTIEEGLQEGLSSRRKQKVIKYMRTFH